jgi:transposase-like protein
MKRTRHSPAQIIGKLRDADGMLAAGRTIGEVCQALGISEATFQRWRQQYGGMKAEEAKANSSLLAEITSRSARSRVHRHDFAL